MIRRIVHWTIWILLVAFFVYAVLYPWMRKGISFFAAVSASLCFAGVLGNFFLSARKAPSSYRLSVAFFVPSLIGLLIAGMWYWLAAGSLTELIDGANGFFPNEESPIDTSTRHLRSLSALFMSSSLCALGTVIASSSRWSLPLEKSKTRKYLFVALTTVIVVLLIDFVPLLQMGLFAEMSEDISGELSVFTMLEHLFLPTSIGFRPMSTISIAAFFTALSFILLSGKAYSSNNAHYKDMTSLNAVACFIGFISLTGWFFSDAYCEMFESVHSPYHPSGFAFPVFPSLKGFIIKWHFLRWILPALGIILSFILARPFNQSKGLKLGAFSIVFAISALFFFGRHFVLSGLDDRNKSTFEDPCSHKGALIRGLMMEEPSPMSLPFENYEFEGDVGKLALPTSSSKRDVPHAIPIWISEDSIVFGDSNQAVDGNSDLKQAFKHYPDNVPTIAADENVPWNRIDSVLNAAHQNGFERFRLLVKNKETSRFRCTEYSAIPILYPDYDEPDDDASEIPTFW